jgi:hypothetical protein
VENTAAAAATSLQEVNVVTENPAPYPVRVDAALDAPLSRGLWLVKWLLLLPHYVVLAFLWIAFSVLTVIAFVAILVTARYPRSLFEFNVGVLRWTWRVHYYGYGALGTDRYPPFTLAEVPEYPAHLDLPYPERLSRGLVLVKWWLLALPHYLVVALFVGGGIWLGTAGRATDGVWDDGWAAGGLVGLLVLVAGVVLLFSGRYPVAVYDFVLGMDRWVIRVAAYAGLMTDRYPPFRLDLGGSDPGSVPSGPAPVIVSGAAAAAGPLPSRPGRQPRPWTAGRVVSLVIGAVLLLVSTGLLTGGGALLWADRTQRNDGFVWSDTTRIDTARYALVSEEILLDSGGADWVLDNFLGTARVEVTAADPDVETFVGVAASRDAAAYLRGVGHHRLDEFGPWGDGTMRPGMMTDFGGGAPRTPPADADIWIAESSGSGTQVLDWRPADGDWTVVVMRADGRAGVEVEARVGVTAPGLGALAAALLGAGAVLLVVGGLLVALAVPRAQRTPGPWTPEQPVPPLPTPRGGSYGETTTSPTTSERT